MYFTLKWTCVCAFSVMPSSLRPRGLWLTRLLRPWDSPGKNTGVGCHILLQGVSPTQALNPHLLHWQAGSLPLVPPGEPKMDLAFIKF